MELKDRLKQLRKEHGLSQQALADTIFVSRSAVAKWEAGLGLPNPESMQALAAFFCLPMEELQTSESETVIMGKNRHLHTQKWVILGVAGLFLLILLLCLLSIPWVSHAETVEFNNIPLPQLRDKWDALLLQCSSEHIEPEDMTVVTVKNIWGEWSLQILPVYVSDVATVPKHGRASWSERLYVLSGWSENNIFTRMCALKLQAPAVTLETGVGAFVSSYVTLFSGSTYVEQYDMRETSRVTVDASFACKDQPAFSVSYHVGTSGKAVEKQLIESEEKEIAQFFWTYTLCLWGKEVFESTKAVIAVDYIVNA